YLIAQHIPDDWIQTTTSRESPRVSVGESPDRSKASARSATIDIGESENVARAAHRRSVENRYADPPEYLTSREYEALKRAPRPDMARPVDMSRPPDMLPAPTPSLWTQPPRVTQNGELDCWAAALSSWLRAVQSPKRATQDALIQGAKAYAGITISEFRKVAEEHGMRT